MDVGFSRAGDCTVGRPAVSGPNAEGARGTVERRAWDAGRPGAWLSIALAALLTGCAAVSDITGAVAGFAAGALTANPAIGIGVGVVVRAGSAEALGHIARVRRDAEHQAIVAAIADAPAGERRTWSVDRKVGGDARGEARVVRLIETPIALCKEVAFTVSRGEDAVAFGDWFTTVACFDGQNWRWAIAEPAIERWINLQ